MLAQTALITGATAGIGFHTAAGLASGGARVLVTGRDAGRGREAVAELRRLAGHDGVELIVADGSSLRSTATLAKEVELRTRRLDVLVNNVGGCFSERRVTGDGFELTLATNFLAPALLTLELQPLLLTGGARIVNIVSSAFSMWKGDPFEQLDATDGYVGIIAYAHAKLLTLLWTLALARRVQDAGVVVNAVNPGMAWTPGTAALTPAAVPHWRLVWPVVRWFQRRASPERAARGPVRLATAANGPSGRYFDEERETSLPQRLLDRSLQDRTWELANRLLRRT